MFKFESVMLNEKFSICVLLRISQPNARQKMLIKNKKNVDKSKKNVNKSKIVKVKTI